MAASTSALTLYDYGAMSNDPLVKKITMGLYDQGVSVLDVLPIANTKSLKANGVRFLAGSLPAVGVRKLNAEPVVVRSVPKKFEEQAYIVSNQFQIDRFLDMEQNAIQDPIDVQFMAWQKSFIRTFSDKFINAVPTTDDDWFSGLRYRLSSTGQTDYDIPSEMNIDAASTAGAGLKFALEGTNAMTSGTAEAFFERLDQALDYVGSPEGNGVTIFVNDTMFRRIATAAKRAQSGNALDQTKDNFDRMITTYRNARLLQLPRKSDDSTKIITDTENAAGTATTGSVCSSLFVCKFGADSFTGWQFEPLAVKDLGIDPTVGTRRNVVVDWACGLFQASPRAVARVYGLQVS
jgi:hypothetical protein